MKSLQKLILPALLIVVISIVYFVYFAPSEELGAFSDFDPNNNAVKDIKVLIVRDRGISPTGQGGATFFVSDKNNLIVQVNADQVSANLETADILILRGHLSSGDVFHAHEVLTD